MENRTETKYPTPQYNGSLNPKGEQSLPLSNLPQPKHQLNQLNTTKITTGIEPHQSETYIDKKGDIVTPPHSKPTMFWDGDKQQTPQIIETEFSVK